MLRPQNLLRQLPPLSAGGLLDETRFRRRSFATTASDASLNLESQGLTAAILRKAQTACQWARANGLREVEAAWQHFLAGSGAFTALPQRRVQLARSLREAVHQQQVLDWVTSPAGARGMLALRGLVKMDGSLKPAEKWSKVVKFKLDFNTPLGLFGDPLESLGFFRTHLRSEFTVNAVLQAENQAYKLSILSWRTWVVDHFDFNAEHYYLGDSGYWQQFFPTSQELQWLIDVGQAKPFSRSSAGWKAEFTSPTWMESFAEESTIKHEADARRESFQQRAEQLKSPQIVQQLSITGPAEEVLAAKHSKGDAEKDA